MRIDVITIFPHWFAPMLESSILKRARTRGRLKIVVHDLRAFTHDKRRTVDDRPYGGGPGMIMKPEPLFEAVEAIETEVHGGLSRRDVPKRAGSPSGCVVILMGPAGARFTQSTAKDLAGQDHLVILAGHYEGVDERVRQALVDRELSIGDYILTGGELPAMVVLDSIARLLPGVVGNTRANDEESFVNGWLEYPQYTRPANFRGLTVPLILRTGDHEEIATWRRLQAVARTLARRPDLLDAAAHSDHG